MDFTTLTAELSGDPLGRGYSGMSDAEVMTDINTANRSVNRASMTPSEVLNAIDIAEWDALTGDQQRQIWDVLHIGDINPFGVEATIFTSVFGVSATTTALQAARTETVSRAAELGLGLIYPGHIQTARA